MMSVQLTERVNFWNSELFWPVFRDGRNGVVVLLLLACRFLSIMRDTCKDSDAAQTQIRIHTKADFLVKLREDEKFALTFGFSGYIMYKKFDRRATNCMPLN